MKGMRVSATTELARTTIYRLLRADILSCALRPGSQIQERELIERFAVSKSPIRDALLKLEEQNLIEILPRKGYRVKPVSLTDARELYDMRLILERECVSRAIDQSDEILSGLNPFRNGPDSEDLSDWIAYNREFHVAIADLCGNARLGAVARDVIEQFDRLTYTSVSLTGPKGRAQFVDEHAAIIDAIQQRDRRHALMLARDHVDGARRIVLETLEHPTIVP
jgi:DNA-binding GntR family transcriptional regulator